MDLKDLAGLSKPLTRLIEVVSEGVGAVSRPYLIRKNADAKAYETKVISEALKEVAENHQLPAIYQDGAVDIWQIPEDRTLCLNPASDGNRIPTRVDYQERKRQNNIEKITSAAAENLAGETDVPEDMPDEDWISRFFGSAQDVSSEEMQILWGRILSGEICRPGSFSIRTLEFVRNISKQEAELIMHMGGVAVSWQGTSFIAVHDKKWLIDEKGIYPSHHFAASEVGAMYPSDLQVNTFHEKEKEQEVFISGKKMLLVNRGEIAGEVHIKVWKFTEIGRQLLGLIQNQEDETYLESIGQIFLKRKGKALLADVLEQSSDGQIKYNIVRELTEAKNPEKSGGDT